MAEILKDNPLAESNCQRIMDMKLLWITSFLLFFGMFAKSQNTVATFQNEHFMDYAINDAKATGYWHFSIPGSFRKPVITNNQIFIYPEELQLIDFSIRNSFEKTIDHLSGTEIIQQYITAIGNPHLLDSVKSLTYIGNIKINKIELGFKEVKHIPNLDDIALYIDHDTVMRSFFDGKAGFNERISQKTILSQQEISERNQDYLGLFNQQYYLNNYHNFFLIDLKKDTINQEDCYRLDIRMPSGKLVSEYYSKQTHFLVKSIESDMDNGIKKITTKVFTDYKPFDNILFPTNINVVTQTDSSQQNFQLYLESINIDE